MKLRFAIRPHRHLRVDDARWALLTWLYARAGNGACALRIDDLDSGGARGAPAGAPQRELAWLGLSWDVVVPQAARAALYAQAADRLRAAGRLYPCFESERELQAKHDRRLRRGQPAVYDRAMLHLTAAQRAAAEAGGKRPYWRFRLSDGTSAWRDGAHGVRSLALAGLSDPIVVRADGTPLRLFADAVDDLDLRVTDALAGNGQEAATAMQRDIQAALGADPDTIAWTHLPVLSCAGPAPPLRRLRGDGVQAAALRAHLARPELGAAALPADATELAAAFSVQRAARAEARFDLRALLAINRRALCGTALGEIADRLPLGATEAFWQAIRCDIDLPRDAHAWWDVVAGDIAPLEGAHPGAAFAAAARAALPPPPWSDHTWRQWVAALAPTTPLCEPEASLRLLLTGETEGPPMSALLPLMDPVRVDRRLR